MIFSYPINIKRRKCKKERTEYEKCVSKERKKEGREKKGREIK